MKFIDLFAGIGGFHLGMEQAGHKCVGWCEWDKFARQSYLAIHDNANKIWNVKDINDVRADEIPQADCWCFGFPCQDISVAGKQKGINDGKRSSLFFTVTQLLRETPQERKPSYLFIENVKNLLSINRGWDFLQVQAELDEIGYDIEWSVLDSAEVVPQHRERLFIIGHLRGRSNRKIFPIIRKSGEANKTDKAVIQIGNISNSQSFDGNPQVGRVYDTNGVSPTLSTMQGGGQEPKILVKDNKIDMVIGSTQKNTSITDGTYSPTLTSAMGMGGGQTPMIVKHGTRYAIRKLTPRECWRLQGFPDWAFTRAREAGLSDSQLYKQAGNSVTVPVIKAIAEKLERRETLE